MVCQEQERPEFAKRLDKSSVCLCRIHSSFACNKKEIQSHMGFGKLPRRVEKIYFRLNTLSDQLDIFAPFSEPVRTRFPVFSASNMTNFFCVLIGFL